MTDFNLLNANEENVWFQTRTFLDGLVENIVTAGAKQAIKYVTDSRQASLQADFKQYIGLSLPEVWSRLPREYVRFAAVTDTQSIEDYVIEVATAAGLFFGTEVLFLRNVQAAVKYVEKAIAETVTAQTNLTAQTVRDMLTIIGGADVVDGTVRRDIYGRHYYEGEANNGMLYTGSLALRALQASRPEYEWAHITPQDRALEAHTELDGKKYTSQSREAALSNSTVGWLGQYFFPGDHNGCQCYERLISI